MRSLTAVMADELIGNEDLDSLSSDELRERYLSLSRLVRSAQAVGARYLAEIGRRDKAAAAPHLHLDAAQAPRPQLERCGESRTSGSGGRPGETERRKRRHRASGRPHWADGGDTDLPNSRLYCNLHHDLYHPENWRFRTCSGSSPPGG